MPTSSRKSTVFSDGGHRSKKGRKRKKDGGKRGPKQASEEQTDQGETVTDLMEQKKLEKKLFFPTVPILRLMNQVEVYTLVMCLVKNFNVTSLFFIGI